MPASLAISRKEFAFYTAPRAPVKPCGAGARVVFVRLMIVDGSVIGVSLVASDLQL